MSKQVKLYIMGTDVQVNVGDKIVNFRGETKVIHKVYPAQDKLICEHLGALYYPSVFSLEFREVQGES